MAEKKSPPSSSTTNSAIKEAEAERKRQQTLFNKNFTIATYYEEKDYFYAKTQVDQERYVAEQKILFLASVAEGNPNPPPGTSSLSQLQLFPEVFEWSDLDPRFVYKLSDIPVLHLREVLKVKVTKFKGIDDIWGELVSDEGRHFRTIIDKELEEYCRDLPFDPDFAPVKGQIVFVKVPSYQEIDEFMEGVFGVEVWHKNRNLDRRTPYESENDGKWMRAECKDYTEGKTGVTVNLVDTGRQLPVAIQHIRPAVFKYVIWPAVGINFMIALQGPDQYSYSLTLKWYKFLPIGTELELQLCGRCGPIFMTRLITPSEDELETKFLWLVRMDTEKDAVSQPGLVSPELKMQLGSPEKVYPEELGDDDDE